MPTLKHIVRTARVRVLHIACRQEAGRVRDRPKRMPPSRHRCMPFLDFLEIRLQRTAERDAS
jgi:hypothetical protein